MSTAMNHARLLTLTARKSDLEYKITNVMMTMQALATQQTVLSEQKYNYVQKSVQNILTNTGDSSAVSSTDSIIDYIANSEYATSFDAQLASLEAAQERLDLEKGKFETEHKAIVAEEESVEKLLNSSIKKEFTDGVSE